MPRSFWWDSEPFVPRPPAVPNIDRPTFLGCAVGLYRWSDYFHYDRVSDYLHVPRGVAFKWGDVPGNESNEEESESTSVRDHSANSSGSDSRIRDRSSSGSRRHVPSQWFSSIRKSRSKCDHLKKPAFVMYSRAEPQQKTVIVESDRTPNTVKCRCRSVYLPSIFDPRKRSKSPSQHGSRQLSSIESKQKNLVVPSNHDKQNFNDIQGFKKSNPEDEMSDLQPRSSRGRSRNPHQSSLFGFKRFSKSPSQRGSRQLSPQSNQKSLIVSTKGVEDDFSEIQEPQENIDSVGDVDDIELKMSGAESKIPQHSSIFSLSRHSKSHSQQGRRQPSLQSKQKMSVLSSRLVENEFNELEELRESRPTIPDDEIDYSQPTMSRTGSDAYRQSTISNLKSHSETLSEPVQPQASQQPSSFHSKQRNLNFSPTYLEEKFKEPEELTDDVQFSSQPRKSRNDNKIQSHSPISSLKKGTIMTGGINWTNQDDSRQPTTFQPQQQEGSVINSLMSQQSSSIQSQERNSTVTPNQVEQIFEKPDYELERVDSDEISDYQSEMSKPNGKTSRQLSESHGKRGSEISTQPMDVSHHSYLQAQQRNSSVNPNQVEQTFDKPVDKVQCVDSDELISNYQPDILKENRKTSHLPLKEYYDGSSEIPTKPTQWVNQQSSPILSKQISPGAYSSHSEENFNIPLELVECTDLEDETYCTELTIPIADLEDETYRTEFRIPRADPEDEIFRTEFRIPRAESEISNAHTTFDLKKPSKTHNEYIQIVGRYSVPVEIVDRQSTSTRSEQRYPNACFVHTERVKCNCLEEETYNHTLRNLRGENKTYREPSISNTKKVLKTDEECVKSMGSPSSSVPSQQRNFNVYHTSYMNEPQELNEYVDLEDFPPRTVINTKTFHQSSTFGESRPSRAPKQSIQTAGRHMSSAQSYQRYSNTDPTNDEQNFNEPQELTDSTDTTEEMHVAHKNFENSVMHVQSKNISLYPINSASSKKYSNNPSIFNKQLTKKDVQNIESSGFPRSSSVQRASKTLISSKCYPTFVPELATPISIFRASKREASSTQPTVYQVPNLHHQSRSQPYNQGAVRHKYPATRKHFSIHRPTANRKSHSQTRTEKEQFPYTQPVFVLSSNLPIYHQPRQKTLDDDGRKTKEQFTQPSSDYQPTGFQKQTSGSRGHQSESEGEFVEMDVISPPEKWNIIRLFGKLFSGSSKADKYIGEDNKGRASEKPGKNLLSNRGNSTSKQSRLPDQSKFYEKLLDDSKNYPEVKLKATSKHTQPRRNLMSSLNENTVDVQRNQSEDIDCNEMTVQQPVNHTHRKILTFQDKPTVYEIPNLKKLQFVERKKEVCIENTSSNEQIIIAQNRTIRDHSSTTSLHEVRTTNQEQSALFGRPTATSTSESLRNPPLFVDSERDFRYQSAFTNREIEDYEHFVPMRSSSFNVHNDDEPVISGGRVSRYEPMRGRFVYDSFYPHPSANTHLQDGARRIESVTEFQTLPSGKDPRNWERSARFQNKTNQVPSLDSQRRKQKKSRPPVTDYRKFSRFKHQQNNFQLPNNDAGRLIDDIVGSRVTLDMLRDDALCRARSFQQSSGGRPATSENTLSDNDRSVGNTSSREEVVKLTNSSFCVIDPNSDRKNPVNGKYTFTGMASPHEFQQNSPIHVIHRENVNEDSGSLLLLEKQKQNTCAKVDMKSTTPTSVPCNSQSRFFGRQQQSLNSKRGETLMYHLSNNEITVTSNNQDREVNINKQGMCFDVHQKGQSINKDAVHVKYDCHEKNQFNRYLKSSPNDTQVPSKTKVLFGSKKDGGFKNEEIEEHQDNSNNVYPTLDHCENDNLIHKFSPDSYESFPLLPDSSVNERSKPLRSMSSDVHIATYDYLSGNINTNCMYNDLPVNKIMPPHLESAALETSLSQLPVCQLDAKLNAANPAKVINTKLGTTYSPHKYTVGRPVTVDSIKRRPHKSLLNKPTDEDISYDKDLKEHMSFNKDHLVNAEVPLHPRMDKEMRIFVKESRVSEIKQSGQNQEQESGKFNQKDVSKIPRLHSSFRDHPNEVDSVMDQKNQKSHPDAQLSCGMTRSNQNLVTGQKGQVETTMENDSIDEVKHLSSKVEQLQNHIQYLQQRLFQDQNTQSKSPESLQCKSIIQDNITHPSKICDKLSPDCQSSSPRDEQLKTDIKNRYGEIHTICNSQCLPSQFPTQFPITKGDNCGVLYQPTKHVCEQVSEKVVILTQPQVPVRVGTKRKISNNRSRHPVETKVNASFNVNKNKPLDPSQGNDPKAKDPINSTSSHPYNSLEKSGPKKHDPTGRANLENNNLSGYLSKSTRIISNKERNDRRLGSLTQSKGMNSSANDKQVFSVYEIVKSSAQSIVCLTPYSSEPSSKSTILDSKDGAYPRNKLKDSSSDPFFDGDQVEYIILDDDNRKMLHEIIKLGIEEREYSSQGKMATLPIADVNHLFNQCTQVSDGETMWNSDECCESSASQTKLIIEIEKQRQELAEVKKLLVESLQRMERKEQVDLFLENFIQDKTMNVFPKESRMVSFKSPQNGRSEQFHLNEASIGQRLSAHNLSTFNNAQFRPFQDGSHKESSIYAVDPNLIFSTKPMMETFTDSHWYLLPQTPTSKLSLVHQNAHHSNSTEGLNTEKETFSQKNKKRTFWQPFCWCQCFLCNYKKKNIQHFEEGRAGLPLKERLSSVPLKQRYQDQTKQKLGENSGTSRSKSQFSENVDGHYNGAQYEEPPVICYRANLSTESHTRNSRILHDSNKVHAPTNNHNATNHTTSNPESKPNSESDGENKTFCGRCFSKMCCRKRKANTKKYSKVSLHNEIPSPVNIVTKPSQTILNCQCGAKIILQTNSGDICWERSIKKCTKCQCKMADEKSHTESRLPHSMPSIVSTNHVKKASMDVIEEDAKARKPYSSDHFEKLLSKSDSSLQSENPTLKSTLDLNKTPQSHNESRGLLHLTRKPKLEFSRLKKKSSFADPLSEEKPGDQPNPDVPQPIKDLESNDSELKPTSVDTSGRELRSAKRFHVKYSPRRPLQTHKPSLNAYTEPSESYSPNEGENSTESYSPNKSEKPAESYNPNESEKPAESYIPNESEKPTEKGGDSTRKISRKMIRKSRNVKDDDSQKQGVNHPVEEFKSKTVIGCPQSQKCVKQKKRKKKSKIYQFLHHYLCGCCIH